MAKSKLFVSFMLRFSLINDQHVKVMDILDEMVKSDKRSKNQIVMDALEYYFNKEINGQNFVDMATFESRLASEREKLRKEIYGDVIQFIAGNALGGNGKVVTGKPIEQEAESVEEAENDYSEYGDNGVKMEDVVKWS